MKPYKIIEHTADIGIEVFGESKEALFINAARGMFSIMDPRPVEHRHQVRKQIQCSGSDDERMLVSWLQELLYLCTVKHLLPVKYESFHLQRNCASVRIRAVHLQISKITYKCEIKAATYHQLKIQNKKGLFNTRIIFDV